MEHYSIKKDIIINSTQFKLNIKDKNQVWFENIFTI